MNQTMKVDIDRIKNDIFKLAEIGREPVSRGIFRMAFSEADMQGKLWLKKQIEDCGLVASVDGAGNVSGLLTDSRGNTQPRFVVGSHIDTVPCAGALDGALGVVVGLECLRCMRQAQFQPAVPVELVAFSDEEGRFGNMFGSEAYTGRLTLERLHSAADLDGIRLWDAMQHAGLDPLGALDAQRDPSELLGYLELHIEQGPVLDKLGIPLGVVENITGLFKWAISLQGVANHAGTTPMNMRHDALMGLADFAHEIPRILEENGGRQSRATIGRAQILPGSANTVPGLVEFSLDVRDTSEEVLNDLALACRKALSAIARRRDLQFSFDQQSWIQPVECSPALTEKLVSAIESAGLKYLRMPSGAAHDAQILASVTPISMLFVPSRDGLSHSPAEWTNWSEIESAGNAMLSFLTGLNRDEFYSCS
jgi:beta-ureidopropionase / N-carbamoyl-L-amino-acid hydrolase